MRYWFINLRGIFCPRVSWTFPDFYVKFQYFYTDIVRHVSTVFPSFPVYEPMEDASVCCTRVTHVCCAIRKGGGVRGQEVNKRVLRGCA